MGIQLSNMAAAGLSLALTLAGVKMVSAVAPLLSTNKEEISVLLSVPLLATPYLYKMVDGFISRPSSAGKVLAGPSSLVTVFTIAGIMTLINNVVSYVSAFFFGALNADRLMADGEVIPSEFQEYLYTIMFPVIYLTLLIGGWLFGRWLGSRHPTTPRRLGIWSGFLYWLAMGSVNIIALQDPEIFKLITGYNLDPSDANMIAASIGVMLGSLIPTCWLTLFIVLGASRKKLKLN